MATLPSVEPTDLLLPLALAGAAEMAASEIGTAMKRKFSNVWNLTLRPAVCQADVSRVFGVMVMVLFFSVDISAIPFCVVLALLCVVDISPVADISYVTDCHIADLGIRAFKRSNHSFNKLSQRLEEYGR